MFLFYYNGHVFILICIRKNWYIKLVISQILFRIKQNVKCLFKEKNNIGMYSLMWQKSWLCFLNDQGLKNSEPRTNGSSRITQLITDGHRRKGKNYSSLKWFLFYFLKYEFSFHVTRVWFQAFWSCYRFKFTLHLYFLCKENQKVGFLKYLNIRSEFFRTGLIGLPFH